MTILINLRKCIFNIYIYMDFKAISKCIYMKIYNTCQIKREYVII